MFNPSTHPQKIQLDNKMKPIDVKASLGISNGIAAHLLPPSAFQASQAPLPAPQTQDSAPGQGQPTQGNNPASSPASASAPSNAAAPQNASAPSSAAKAPATPDKTEDLQNQITSLKQEVEKGSMKQEIAQIRKELEDLLTEEHGQSKG